MKSFTAFFALSTLSVAVAQVSPWGQCGGQGWTGSTVCTSGYCCVKSNDWYSQCIQGSSCGGATTTARITTTSARPVTTASVRTTTRVATTTTRTSAANPAATTFCGQWDGLVTSNNYGVYNNLWNQGAATSGSQCTWFNGIVGSGVSWGTQWTWTGGPYQVKSYATAGKLVEPPRLISSITSLPSTFIFTNTVSSGTVANVAYDLFTAADPTVETWAGDYELMIWVASYGGAGPISATGSPIATVTIAGQPWRLYSGLNGNMRVFSFVYANGVLNNFSGDVKLFYNYLTSSQGFPASSQYLLAFQAGTEPFLGSGTLQVSQYSAAVN